MRKIDKLILDEKIKTAPLILKPNYIKIPVTQIPVSTKGVDLFNKFYFALKDDELPHKIVRTPSGGISIKHGNFKLPCYDIIPQYTAKNKFKGIEITVLSISGMCRIQFSSKPENGLSGTQAFRKFVQICKKFDIDIENYAVDYQTGKAAKEQIEKPLIKLQRPSVRNGTYRNVHHIDYNSSFPSGLINTHPEFKPAIEYIYEQHVRAKKNHTMDLAKSILNNSIGYMQSPCTKYAYTLLARDAINDNHDRIVKLAETLTKAHRVILAYNTDGIWYAGDIYHNKDEGECLGQWKNDHVNCTFRAKSDGAYEFIEDGIYHPVVRGRTIYDTIKPRTEWQWGDIYRSDCNPIIYTFDERKGICYESSL